MIHACIHYITSHFKALHNITWHDITILTITYHYIPLHTITYHYIPLHTITYHYIPSHTITYRYIPLHTITLHYITLYYITLQYIYIYYTHKYRSGRLHVYPRQACKQNKTWNNDSPVGQTHFWMVKLKNHNDWWDKPHVSTSIHIFDSKVPSLPESHNSLMLESSTSWWYTYPSEKYEFVSWDDSSQYMESHKIHVPNHQSDPIILASWDDYSQIFPIYGKKNVPNHQPAKLFTVCFPPAWPKLIFSEVQRFCEASIRTQGRFSSMQRSSNWGTGRLGPWDQASEKAEKHTWIHRFFFFCWIPIKMIFFSLWFRESGCQDWEIEAL